MKKIPKKIITIIGCGASGIALFLLLVDLLIENKLQNKVKIFLIDKDSIATGGVAYHTEYACNLLNIPAIGMSIIHNNENHFYKWILHRQKEIKEEFPHFSLEPGEHFPRKLFSRYLKDTFHTALTIANRIGLQVSTMIDEVVDIEQKPEGYKLIFKKNKSLMTDYITLSVGGFETKICSSIDNLKNYFPSPYLKSKPLIEISKETDVFIIGTRLSAMDAILMLKSNQHFGKITCFSRNGQLPRVQGVYEMTEKPTIIHPNIIEKLTAFGKKNLKLNQILGLIRCEAEIQENKILDCKKIYKFYKNQRGLLKKEIELSINKIRPWQSALFKTNKMINSAWMKLNSEDQNLIYEKYLGYFLTYRSAMPVKTAIKIYDLMKKKQLAVLSSRLLPHFEPKNNKFIMPLSATKKIAADYVINATGISSDVSQSDQLLIKNLLKKEMITPHRLGGCEVDLKTLNAVQKNKEMNPSLFIMGAMTQGVHLSTSLLEHLVDCAFLIGHTILNRLTNGEKNNAS